MNPVNLDSAIAPADRTGSGRDVGTSDGNGALIAPDNLIAETPTVKLNRALKQIEALTPKNGMKQTPQRRQPRKAPDVLTA
jgi:hypothetical protein